MRFTLVTRGVSDLVCKWPWQLMVRDGSVGLLHDSVSSDPWCGEGRAVTLTLAEADGLVGGVPPTMRRVWQWWAVGSKVEVRARRYAGGMSPGTEPIAPQPWLSPSRCRFP